VGICLANPAHLCPGLDYSDIRELAGPLVRTSPAASPACPDPRLSPRSRTASCRGEATLPAAAGKVASPTGYPTNITLPAGLTLCPRG